MIFTCADVSCLDAWSTFRRSRKRMSTQDFCGCARGSSNYTVWWSVAGRTCTRIHTLVAFYDGNRTAGRHYQFALPQTFSLILGFRYFYARLSHTTPSFLLPSGALNLCLKCVLNGLLTWYSCNPPFLLFVWKFCSKKRRFYADEKKSYSLTLQPQQ